jgi:hypothetical protein
MAASSRIGLRLDAQFTPWLFLALQGGARDVESLKRRTVTAPDVTECYSEAVDLCFVFCVHIRFCGHGGLGFRPYGGSLWKRTPK